MLSKAPLDGIIGAWSPASTWCVDFVSHYVIEKPREALQTQSSFRFADGVVCEELP